MYDDLNILYHNIFNDLGVNKTHFNEEQYYDENIFFKYY